MLKNEYIVYQCIQFTISNNTASHLKIGQQLYWIYTEGKSLIMKLSHGVYIAYEPLFYFAICGRYNPVCKDQDLTPETY